jgi:hypothetical protein
VGLRVGQCLRRRLVYRNTSWQNALTDHRARASLACSPDPVVLTDRPRTDVGTLAAMRLSGSETPQATPQGIISRANSVWAFSPALA